MNYNRKEALKAINDTLDKANIIYPETFNSLHEGFAILKEEVDELWEAIIKKKDNWQIREEAAQTAAIAIKLLISIGTAKKY